MTKTTSNSILNIMVWIVQIALAAVFLMAGYMKLFSPIEELSAVIPWVQDTPKIFVRLIGAVDFIGGAAVLLPSLFKKKVHYAYCAAWSLCIVMVLATVFHLIRGEFEAIPITLILFGLLYFVGWGRYKKVPIGTT